MTRPIQWRWLLKHAALVVALAAVIVLALPLTAMAVFAARFVVLGLFVLGLLALALSPRARRWLESEAETASEYLGLRMPADEMVSPEHTWARIDAPARVTTGVDDLLQRALGPITTVELPEPGGYIRQGELLARLHSNGRTLAVRAPVSGKILRVNEQLTRKPALLNDAPYGLGWTAVIEPLEMAHDRRRLRRDGVARTWLRAEIDRLLAAVTPVQPVLAMQDGGHVSPDLHKLIDEQAWERIKGGFFGDK